MLPTCEQIACLFNHGTYTGTKIPQGRWYKASIVNKKAESSCSKSRWIQIWVPNQGPELKILWYWDSRLVEESLRWPKKNDVNIRKVEVIKQRFLPGRYIQKTNTVDDPICSIWSCIDDPFPFSVVQTEWMVLLEMNVEFLSQVTLMHVRERNCLLLGNIWIHTWK